MGSDATRSGTRANAVGEDRGGAANGGRRLSATSTSLRLLIWLALASGLSAQSAAAQSSTPLPSAAAPRVYMRAAPAAAVSPQPAPADTRLEGRLNALESELNATREELRGTRQELADSQRLQRAMRLDWIVFLCGFGLLAGLLAGFAYWQARRGQRRASAAAKQAEAAAAELAPLRGAQAAARRALPDLLQAVGEQPLSFQEEGEPFDPRALTVLEDIEHLAYLGESRLTFGSFESLTEAAVYLNGLLLAAASHLARRSPWRALARLDRFFEVLTRYPEAVDHRRMAQGYSYRALAAYQVLEAQDSEPSWLRRADRAQVGPLRKQSFADLAHAAGLDPEWRHSTFVEALLCSRFFLAEEAEESGSRKDLHVRGLRRAVTLYKSLIEEKAYRGPSRRNLIRCLKQIAELTAEKSDFSDFGYALSSLPSDEELWDEALAMRQPASQDRFLWQWLIGDEELFCTVERLNLAEYRSFWIRMLDNKVHLRNWRADLAELQQRRPQMKDWSVQLLYGEQPSIVLANPLPRRQERFEGPVSSL